MITIYYVDNYTAR